MKVKLPEASELARDTLIIAIMDPWQNAALKAMADAGISAFAMELWAHPAEAAAALTGFWRIGAASLRGPAATAPIWPAR
jgi:hypothetical protein